MTEEFTILSPAKINLNLRVLGAREDGFHEIESTVQPVDIFDEVRMRISKRGGVSLRADSPGIPFAEKNTAFIAARLFMQKAGIAAGADIFLKKNIPAGAGLGGGSGNAAAVLAGLNRVFGVFGDKELREIGGEVGADVPLFINCRACGVSGTGGKVKILNDFPLFSYVVCFPGFECRTADVYKKWDRLNPSASREGGNPPRGESQSRGCGEQLWRASPPVEMANDLEPAAFCLYPRLADFRVRLGSDCDVPFLMTGSGSAFFSVFEKESEAREVFERIGSAGDFQCFLARGVEGWREKNGERFSAGL